MASSSINGSDPDLATRPQAYGFNGLLLNKTSTAMLDVSQPSYISAVQSLLAGGESWNITASVSATVATFNNSRAENETEYESYLKSFCEAAQESSGAHTHQSMMNHWSVVLLDHASLGTCRCSTLVSCPIQPYSMRQIALTSRITHNCTLSTGSSATAPGPSLEVASSLSQARVLA